MFTKAANRLQKGFTLIEILVVIGILGILATVALVAINPAEAQKKARDAGRLQDMATLQSAIEEYLSDNPGAAAIPAGWAAGVNSSGGLKTCGANWLTVNLCPYLTTVPVDPSNRNSKVTNDLGVPSNQNAYYYFKYANGAYKICTYLESVANKARVANANDGGNVAAMLEVGSDNANAVCP